MTKQATCEMNEMMKNKILHVSCMVQYIVFLCGHIQDSVLLVMKPVYNG